jgi:hypothetical protein
MKTPFHIMIIPTTWVPVTLQVCWSSEEGSPIMIFSVLRLPSPGFLIFEMIRYHYRSTAVSHSLQVLFFSHRHLRCYRRGLQRIGLLLHPDKSLADDSRLASIFAAYHIPIWNPVSTVQRWLPILTRHWLLQMTDARIPDSHGNMDLTFDLSAHLRTNLSMSERRL